VAIFHTMMTTLATIVIAMAMVAPRSMVMARLGG
jgi:hypothetical protein